MLVLRRIHYLVELPPKANVVHAATYLHRSPGWANGRRFAKLNAGVEAQLRGSPGALAYAVQRLLVGREFWTLSLWTDRQSMLKFVRTDRHRAAADWLRSAEEDVGKFAVWEAAGPSLSFDEAYRRLGVTPPSGRVMIAPGQVPEGWRSYPR